MSGRLTAYILFTALFMGTSNAQQANVDLKHYAIPITTITKANDTVYAQLADYKVILIGEVHGTQEPAAFVEGFARGFLSHGREVILGMEIPSDQMEPFIKSRTKAGLEKAAFFNTSFENGRKSEAWANLILNLRKTKITYVFFDETAKQSVSRDDRDSLMYENINQALREHPNAVFIGLCGNNHNKIKLFRGNKTMGWFLQNAGNNFLKGNEEQLISLNHVYSKGTAYCITTGKSAPELTSLGGYNEFSVVDYENYLLRGDCGDYSGVVYSKKVTASFNWIKPKDKR